MSDTRTSQSATVAFVGGLAAGVGAAAALYWYGSSRWSQAVPSEHDGQKAARKINRSTPKCAHSIPGETSKSSRGDAFHVNGRYCTMYIVHHCACSQDHDLARKEGSTINFPPAQCRNRCLFSDSPTSIASHPNAASGSLQRRARYCL
jgi:hypothetical protein